jgi:thiol-disulfide isomerase/thioredoxin
VQIIVDHYIPVPVFIICGFSFFQYFIFFQFFLEKIFIFISFCLAVNQGEGAVDVAEVSVKLLQEVSVDSELSVAVAVDGLTVVDFWAPWRKNCKKIDPLIDKLAAELAGSLLKKTQITRSNSIKLVIVFNLQNHQ